jgi:hypothetical protein
MITLPVEYWYIGVFIVLSLLTWFGYQYFILLKIKASDHS